MNSPEDRKIELLEMIDGLIKSRPSPDDEFVIVNPPLYVYGGGEFRTPAFRKPLEFVAIMPARMAMRVHEFTGGTVVSVTSYLVRIRRHIISI